MASCGSADGKSKKRKQYRDAAAAFTHERGESSGSAARFLDTLARHDLMNEDDVPTQGSIRMRSQRERKAWARNLVTVQLPLQAGGYFQWQVQSPLQALQLAATEIPWFRSMLRDRLPAP